MVAQHTGHHHRFSTTFRHLFPVQKKVILTAAEPTTGRCEHASFQAKFACRTCISHNAHTCAATFQKRLEGVALGGRHAWSLVRHRWTHSRITARYHHHGKASRCRLVCHHFCYCFFNVIGAKRSCLKPNRIATSSAGIQRFAILRVWIPSCPALSPAIWPAHAGCSRLTEPMRTNNQPKLAMVSEERGVSARRPRAPRGSTGRGTEGNGSFLIRHFDLFPFLY